MSEKSAENVLHVRYDGRVGQRISVTRPGFGPGERFQADEVKPLAADWARQLVQHGPFDLCLQRKDGAKRLGLTLKAFDKLKGLTLADVVVAQPETATGSEDAKAELPAVRFVVLDTQTRRILAQAGRDAAKTEEG